MTGPPTGGPPVYVCGSLGDATHAMSVCVGVSRGAVAISQLSPDVGGAIGHCTLGEGGDVTAHQCLSSSPSLSMLAPVPTSRDMRQRCPVDEYV